MEHGTFTHSIVSYTFAAAIPVVAMALWTEYFKKFTFETSVAPSDRNTPSEEHFNQDRMRLRAATFFTLFAQAMIYIASAPIREPAWLPCALVFAATLLLQNSMTRKTENELREFRGIPAEAVPSEASPTEQNRKIAYRILTWNLFSMLAYIATVQVIAISFAAFAILLAFPREGIVAMTLLGGLLGISIGLAFTFALAPLQARKTLPLQPVRDPEIEALLKRLKMRVLGLHQELDTSIVETQDTQWANAWVAGFSGAKGHFRPHLFLTSTLMRHFHAKEIEAVLLHELGHVRLDHLRSRFVRSMFYLGIATILLAGLTLLGFALLPPPVLGVPLMVATFAGIAIPMQKIRTLVEKQENEADFFVVDHLKGDSQFYISVLEKLIRIHPSQLGNQALQMRIDAIRKQFPTPTAQEEENSSNQKAA